MARIRSIAYPMPRIRSIAYPMPPPGLVDPTFQTKRKAKDCSKTQKLILKVCFF